MQILSLPWLAAPKPKAPPRLSLSGPGGRKRSAIVASTTGPLAPLSGKRALLLADVENLSISASDLGRSLCFRSLDRVLRRHSTNISCHAFFSRKAEDNELVDAFMAIGWRAHPRDIQIARTTRGIEKFANSDHTICFGAGMLLSRSTYDVVVIATGDGALGCDLAKAIREHSAPGVSIITMSLAGSTSHRLNAANNADFDSNIEIGSDCLNPIVKSVGQYRNTRPDTSGRDSRHAIAW
ncbi:hypothetical protein [Shimia sp.]|uniref:hypothetical protein n=1 Tax=Shimia sp. TaxID=1954381 RepID=UPI003BA881E3